MKNRRAGTGAYSAIMMLLIVACQAPKNSTIDIVDEIPGIGSPVMSLQSALDKQGSSSDYSIKIQLVDDPEIGAEGFRINRDGTDISIESTGASGLRYGVLDLTEQLLIRGTIEGIEPVLTNPTFDVRAIKFNLPWDAYRESESMDLHLSTCRDLKFWESFLDMMMANRFNTLSLYNMHPFHYMVKLDKFPEANSFTDAEMAEWTVFWKGLFKMAKDRGVDVFVVNWNIVIPESFAAKHGLKVLNDTSHIVKDYTRESVREVINTYEDLAGIGVTLADWMNRMTPAEREDWIDETFVEGINTANRKVKFLHRAVLSGSADEMKRILDAADLPEPVAVEVKFNWSHGHSTPKLVITHASSSGQVNTAFWDPEPENYKIQWMIRNEDFWILRWGQPDFIRAHIQENNADYVNGYYIGSEGYIPAFEYFTKPEVAKTWEYAFDRQWLFYSVWGRLLYDSGTPDMIFEEQFNRKYKFMKGIEMLDAYKLASRMPLRLASFFSGTWDYTLYAEGFMAPMVPDGYGLNDKQSLFISIDELIDHKVLDPKYVSIKDFVSQNGEVSVGKVSPVQLADELDNDANLIEEILQGFESDRDQYGVEYSQELDDIATWMNLSKYFATKIRAGVALENYRNNGSESDKSSALGYLERCLSYWQEVSEITDRNYDEVPYFKGSTSEHRDRDMFSWKKYLVDVERDIALAQGSSSK